MTDPTDGRLRANRATRPLTEKQARVAVERLADPDAANMEIMRRAGYAPSTANAAKRSGVDAWKLARRFEMEQGIRPAEARRIGLETLTDIARTGEQESSRGASAKVLLDWSSQSPGDERPELSAAAALLLHRRRRLALRVISFCLRSPDRAIRLGEILHALVHDPEAEGLVGAARAELLGKDGTG